MISVNQEDYMRAMYHLWEENEEVSRIKHTGSCGVKSNEIAQYMKVSKPSVSKMMKELAGKGLVKAEPYGKLEFTSKGKKIAQDLTAKHRIIELFLKDVLGIGEEKIHNLAHKLEHAFDDECVSKLRALLGNPKSDPHGKPIPQ